MAASQSCWRDRLLFGGIAISLLLHALVLFGGRTTAPAGAALPVGMDAPQRGRRLMGLLGGLTGGSTSSGGLLGGVTGGSTSSGGLLGTGLVDGLNVVSGRHLRARSAGRGALWVCLQSLVP